MQLCEIFHVQGYNLFLSEFFTPKLLFFLTNANKEMFQIDSDVMKMFIHVINKKMTFIKNGEGKLKYYKNPLFVLYAINKTRVINHFHISHPLFKKEKIKCLHNTSDNKQFKRFLFRHSEAKELFDYCNCNLHNIHVKMNVREKKEKKLCKICRSKNSSTYLHHSLSLLLTMIPVSPFRMLQIKEHMKEIKKQIRARHLNKKISKMTVENYETLASVSFLKSVIDIDTMEMDMDMDMEVDRNI